MYRAKHEIVGWEKQALQDVQNSPVHAKFLLCLHFNLQLSCSGSICALVATLLHIQSSLVGVFLKISRFLEHLCRLDTSVCGTVHVVMDNYKMSRSIFHHECIMMIAMESFTTTDTIITVMMMKKIITG